MSLSQHASGWDAVSLTNESRWIPAQKHTGMTVFIYIFSCLCEYEDLILKY